MSKFSVLVLVALVAGCSGAGGDATDEAELKRANDPCTHLAATIHDTNGDRTFVGTNGPDVIFGTNGVDHIYGNGGDDVICARDGDDIIDGGGGNDYIDAGGGADIVHGRGGSDTIYGGGGADILFGDILDDNLYGEDGADILVGGHGTDFLHGGEGDDWLRGDTGNDTFIGGKGSHDVVSFMTAMPPGQSLGNNAHVNGVIVDFTDTCVQGGGDTATHDGCASGDGYRESLDGVEEIVGSPYDDRFVSAGGHHFHGEYGDDQFAIGGTDTSDAKGKVPGTPFVYVSNYKRDPGVIAIGTTGTDALAAVSNGTAGVGVGGKALFHGPGCNPIDADDVACPIAGVQYVAIYGDDGDDTIAVSGTFPREFEAHASGGKGSDTIFGDDEADVFFSGVDGADLLMGKGGDDALLSESTPFPQGMKPMGSAYAGGADKLWGGDGDDQLVADYPCGHHEFHGGLGHDIAGFARSGEYDIKAQLGGPVSDPMQKQNFHGHAFNPDLCPDFATWGTTIADDLEVLEGADGKDELWGDDTNNVLWGRDGDDRLYGLGGDDVILGAKGDDIIYGGAGQDVMEGDKGADKLFAKDGERDRKISCGTGGTLMTKDADDPPGTNCASP